MTYPPQQPGPYGQQGPYEPQGPHGPGGPVSGGHPGQQPSGGQQHGDQHAGRHPRPGPGYGQPGPQQPPWGPQPYGAPARGPQHGQPYGPPAAPQGGFAQPGGYPAPPVGPNRRSALPWLLVGGGVLLVAVIAVVLIGLGGGSTGSARATAQAYADAITNKKKPDNSLYCDSLLRRAEDATRDLPNGAVPSNLPTLPNMRISAAVTEVMQNGDTASASVRVDTELAGQKASAVHKLTIRKEGGGWKICDIDLELPRVGGG